MNSRRRATLKDVAALAGVSGATASRVLNNRPGRISVQTEQRVREAAAQLGYQPHSTAVALRTGKSRTIGVIVPDLVDSQYNAALTGIDAAVWENGYRMLVASTRHDPGRELQTVDALITAQVDGLIFIGGGYHDDHRLESYDYGDVPVVTVGYGSNRMRFPRHVVDNAAAIADATRHLASIGCTSMLCLTADERWITTQDRLAGFRKGLEQAGQPYSADRTLSGEYTIESGQSLVAKAIEDGVAFDGICAFSDLMGVGAIRAVMAVGRRVPDDVAVIGCNNLPLAALTSPSLSSANIHQYELGYSATERILGLRDFASDELRIPHELVLRESTNCGQR
jgi:DNA-binding LacI/PurR family transcriptional regulator